MNYAAVYNSDWIRDSALDRLHRALGRTRWIPYGATVHAIGN